MAAEGASAPLLMDLAGTAVKQKDYQGALGYLAHARSLEPNNATVHFLFGMVCVEENLVREAYESMKKAVELDPDNPLDELRDGRRVHPPPRTLGVAAVL